MESVNVTPIRGGRPTGRLAPNQGLDRRYATATRWIGDVHVEPIFIKRQPKSHRADAAFLANRPVRRWPVADTVWIEVERITPPAQPLKASVRSRQRRGGDPWAGAELWLSG